MTTRGTTGELAHRFASVNGVRLHYVEAGRGPLVVLLHGFPQYWYMWRRQIAVLAERGFQVVAPDLRGYHLSDKPAGVRAYRMEALVGDVVGLVRHAGAERATVVGHDWGGLIAWEVARSHPDVVERLVVLNAPHPAAFARELRTLDQARRSMYAAFFQLPWFPEAVLSAGGFDLVRRGLAGEAVRPDAFTEDDLAHYVGALREPGALTAALNYYRAVVRRLPRARSAARQPIPHPALVIWGDRDSHLSPALTRGLEQWVPSVRVEHLPDASHWVVEDAPERVNELLLEFLTAKSPAAGRRSEIAA